MKKRTFILISLTLLAVSASISFLSAEPLEDEAGMLTRDIQSLNLINMLNLSSEQMKRLIPIAEKAEKLRSGGVSISQRDKSLYVKDLREIKKQLLTSSDVSRETRKSFGRSNKSIKSAKEGKLDGMDSLVRDVQGVLNENQRVLITEYKACIIPIKSISNPERIGQAEGSRGVERILEKSRKVSIERYSKVKKKLLAKMDEKLAKKRKYKDRETREKILTDLSSAMDNARKMSDNEFQLKKQEMAEKIIPDAKEKRNLEERYIKRFLLGSNVPNLLREKLQVTK